MHPTGGLATLLAAVAFSALPAAGQRPSVDWPVYGGDAGGARYSALTDINRTNVARLQVAWTFRTGHAAIATRSDEPRFETTPIVVDGTLYLTTPLGELIALDPATGVERWRFDPRSRRNADYGDFANRGVTAWLDPQAAVGAPCRRRIFVATIDARLFAVDGTPGRCSSAPRSTGRSGPSTSKPAPCSGRPSCRRAPGQRR